MALKKSELRAILKNEDSTHEEKLSEILNMLHEEVDTVKDSRDSLQADLDEAKEKIKNLEETSKNTDSEWKEKYEKEHADFETYKTEQTEKATKDAQKQAYVEMLKEAGISEKMISLIVNTKESDAIMSGIKFDENGAVVKDDELAKKVKEDYKDFIVTSSTEGAKTSTPPNNDGATLTKEQIYATDEKGRYKLSTEERQKALIELSKGEN